MSGGSHNYLCHQDAEHIRFMLSDLESMRQDLCRYRDGEFAAGATAKLAERLAELDALIDSIDEDIARLSPVWRAVEWHHSGDSDASSVIRAIAEWREENQ